MHKPTNNLKGRTCKMSCFTSQITTTHNGVIVSMVFLFSHPEWLEVPEKKLPVAPSTAGKGTEV